MKKLSLCGIGFVLIFGMVSLAVIWIGCTDPGSPIIDDDITTPGRVVVFESSAAPPMDDPLNEIWSDAITGAIKLGEDDYPSYGGERGIFIKAIKASGRLYIRAEWIDDNDNRRPQALSHILTPVIDPDTEDTLYSISSWMVNDYSYDIDTSHVICDTTKDSTCTPHGDTLETNIDTVSFGADQDRFAIIWDMGDNPDRTSGERADCMSMCHDMADTSDLGHRMYTTGGGHVDVWHWQAGNTDPILLARDECWSSAGRELDQHTQLIESFNFDSSAGLPLFAHRDSTEYTGAALLVEDAITFDETWEFDNGDLVPGYVLDGSVTGSIADISAFSVFSTSGYRWIVVMSRELEENPDDIDFTSIASGDSVMVTMAITNNSSALHAGSKPFYVIFP